MDDATGLEGRDGDAERALREALRAEPSAALVARVRAELSRPRPVRVSPWLAAAAATAVLAGGLGILRSPTAAVPDPRRSPIQTAHGGAVSLPVPPTQAAASERVEPAPRPRLQRHPDAARESLWPTREILVEPGQAEALVQLASLALSGEISPPGSLLEADTLDGPPPLEPLAVEPLVIAPLDPPVIAERDS